MAPDTNVEGQYPAEPETNPNVSGGDGQPAVAPVPPVYSQPVYSPPPAYAPPQQYAPYPVAPPPPKRRRAGLVLLIIGIVLVLLLTAGGVVAALANASLSSTYSPEKAVTDYFAAQKHGDVVFMFNNANYLRGDGSYSQFFDGGGIGAMLAIAQNTDITDVKVASTTVVDSNTRTVNVTMTWAGHHVVQAFTVHRDLARVHYNFYNSWRIDIPFATITVTLPNQPGIISVDGLTLPQTALTTIQVIQGFHKVKMDGTDLYDNASADADVIDGGASVAFPSTLSTTAVAAAKKAIKAAFNLCDKATNARQDCLNRTYHSPNAPNTRYFFDMPGYGQIFYNTFVFSLTSDPTKNMKLTVSADADKVAASGTCAYTMTVDGSRKYYFKGTWTATLTTSGGSFGYDLTYFCTKSKA